MLCPGKDKKKEGLIAPFIFYHCRLPADVNEILTFTGEMLYLYAGIKPVCQLPSPYLRKPVTVSSLSNSCRY